MERLNILEKEISDLRKALYEKENDLYELKKKWVSESQLPQLVFSEVQQQYVAYELVSKPAPEPCPKDPVQDKLPRWAIERYSRQILLPEIGVSGQERLCRARVLVVGAGGLGCPAAAYLAGAGVAEIGIVDYDTVEVTNLHRQLLHCELDQFMNKVESAANALRRINSHITVTPYHLQLDSSNALDVLSRYDVVLDCTDNVPTRYMLNDACVLLKIPLISGSALKLEGQLTVYAYRNDRNPTEKDSTHRGPCYRCLFPTPPPPETVGSCSANGVAGPVPGVMGTLQAMEAIKYIVGKTHKDLMVGRMLLFDAEDTSFRNVKLRGRNQNCAACSDNPTVTQLLDYETFCKAKAKEKRRDDAKKKAMRRKEEKEKRMSGQSYFGFRKTKLSAEDKEKWIQDVPKNERKMGPPCKSEFCAKGLTRSCTVLSEERRHEIFSEFWNVMDWKGKKTFVKSLVDSIPPKRRRLKHKGETSRKGDSKVYHLFNENERIPVCRVMFLNTLGVKEAMVRCWLLADEDENKPKGPKKKPIKALNVDAYIDTLPKLPPKCNYCRSFTTRLYLDATIKNQHQLYNKYIQDMLVQGVDPASRKTFTKVFNAKNVGIFKPKNENDVCDLFSQHNMSAEPTYQPVEIQVTMPAQQLMPQTYVTQQW